MLCFNITFIRHIRYIFDQVNKLIGFDIYFDVF